MTVLQLLPQKRQFLSPLLVPEEAWSEVDEALYRPQDLFNLDEDEAERLRFRAIQRSLQYHYEMNPFYREVCRHRGFRTEEVKTIDDVSKIPLIPDAVFKGCRGPKEFLEWLSNLGPRDLEYPSVRDQSSYDSIMEELHDSGITITYSSGTTGRFTFVPRDQLTWKRACYAIAAETSSLIPSYSDLLSSPDDGNVLLLMPHPRRTFVHLGRAASVGFDLFPNAKMHPAIDRTFSTEILRLSQGHTHGFREKLVARVIRRIGKRTAEKADYRMIELMTRLGKEGKGGILSGPPFWIARILSKVEQSIGSLSLGDKWLVMTGGGWKLMEFAKVPAAKFRDRVSSTLGVPESNIHDVYGMAECNVIFPSCDGHYKHIPSTVLQPFILDEAFDPVPYGRVGRFAFIDTLARSYPGFVITGDQAKILERCPACSRPGPVLDQEITRMPGMGDRGCATVVSNYVQGQTR